MATSSIATVPIEPAAPLLAAPRRHTPVGWQIVSSIRRNPAAMISLIVLLIVPVIGLFRKLTFESRKWKDSMFSTSGSDDE